MGQVIALDTSILIYHLEQRMPYVKVTEEVMLSIERGVNQGEFASVGILELLVAPKKLGRNDLAQEYKKTIITFPHLTIGNLTEAVVDLAADLRARYGLQTPDAIHLASAIVHNADLFLTNDRQLKKVKEIPVYLLSEWGAVKKKLNKRRS